MNKLREFCVVAPQNPPKKSGGLRKQIIAEINLKMNQRNYENREIIKRKKY